MEITEKQLDELAVVLRQLNDEQLFNLLAKAQIAIGWNRKKGSRTLPYDTGGEPGSEGWYRQADTLELVPLWGDVDAPAVAEVENDRKHNRWVTEAVMDDGELAEVGVATLVDALAIAEEVAVADGWIIRNSAFDEDDGEDAEGEE
jgi:hypothetical protein